MGFRQLHPSGARWRAPPPPRRAGPSGLWAGPPALRGAQRAALAVPEAHCPARRVGSFEAKDNETKTERESSLTRCRWRRQYLVGKTKQRGEGTLS